MELYKKVSLNGFLDLLLYGFPRSVLRVSNFNQLKTK